MSKVSIPKYSLAEELINSISHGIGATLSIVALVFVILRAHSAVGVTTGVIYCVIMFLLYTISCIYHALSPKLLGKKVLRVIDHCNVMLMVAGTYTPLCLSMIGGLKGLIMFLIVWLVTIIAVVFNSIDVDKYQVISVVCNLVLGWAALFLIKDIIAVSSLKAVYLLIGGGVVYSVGAILYGLGSKKKYMHSIFHFFVLAASFLHFCLIYFYAI